MAKTQKVDTDTASIVDEKNSTVETTETQVADKIDVKPDSDDVQDKPVKGKTDKPATEKKPKEIDDNAKVIIKCVAYAGKSIILPTRTIELDEKGNCEVTGAEAKRLLTIPGYELAK